MMTHIVVLSLSLVSLASAAAGSDEIIARQALKIQSLEDENKALKKVNRRRLLMSDSDSDFSYSDDYDHSDQDNAQAWGGFVSNMCALKDNANAMTTPPSRGPIRRGGEEEEEEELDLEVERATPLYHLTSSITRCYTLSGSTIGRVPAFKRFVAALKNKVEYSSAENVKCMICSLKKMYDDHLSEACGAAVLDPQGRIEETTFNPLVVMAPNKWLNNSDCLALINPSEEECENAAFVGDKCVMPVPSWGDLKKVAAENKHEASQKTEVYTAEAAMIYFELDLPVTSFNFILNRFLEQSSNPIVYEQQRWEDLEENFKLNNVAQALAPPIRRRRLRTQSPNGMS